MISTQCTTCAWLYPTGTPGLGLMRCAAFPAGIPASIVTGAQSHATPVAGDHGLQYRMAPAYAEAARRALNDLARGA